MDKAMDGRAVLSVAAQIVADDTDNLNRLVAIADNLRGAIRSDSSTLHNAATINLAATIRRNTNNVNDLVGVLACALMRLSKLEDQR